MDSTGVVREEPGSRRATNDESDDAGCAIISARCRKTGAPLDVRSTPNSDYFMTFATVLRKSADFRLLTLCLTTISVGGTGFP